MPDRAKGPAECRPDGAGPQNGNMHGAIVDPKVAVVTGAGSGIGAATAVALAEDGWRVIICGRRPEPLADLAANHHGLQLEPITADVTDEESVRSLFRTAVERWRRVDLLFNNAGMGGLSRELDEVPLAEWQAVVDLNLTRLGPTGVAHSAKGALTRYFASR